VGRGPRLVCWLSFGRLGVLGGGVTGGLLRPVVLGLVAVVGFVRGVGPGRVLVARRIAMGAGGCRVGLSRRGGRVWGGRNRGL
jgi:hypothetical protein